MQSIFEILCWRLNMENPSKQWLAVELVSHLLEVCAEQLRPFRGDLIYAVACVAHKPNKKGSAKAQAHARRSANEFLQRCGQIGHLAFMRVQLGLPPLHELDYHTACSASQPSLSGEPCFTIFVT
jgi:hypothetical protein